MLSAFTAKQRKNAIHTGHTQKKNSSVPAESPPGGAAAAAAEKRNTNETFVRGGSAAQR